MSQEKRDTGNLTGQNRQSNEGRYGRGWRAFAIPLVLLILVSGGMMGWIIYNNNRPTVVVNNQIPQNTTKLPDLDSDSYTSQAQVIPGSTGGPAPMPPEIQEALDKLQAERDALATERQQVADQNAGTGNANPPRPRVRQMSHGSVRRPAEGAAGGGGNVQNASMEGGSGGSGGGAGSADGDSRRGSVFSGNRLEKNFACQASAGQVVTLKLPEGFNTEQEGEVTAQVTGDNWSRDRKCVTIPQGSWFHGHYKTEVARGQQRVSLVFTSIERPPFPDGRPGDTIMLEGAKAYERDGRAGLTGEVNSNIPWGMIIASTVIDLGTAFLSNAGDGSGTDINIGGTIANNTGGVLRDVARDRYQKAPASIDVEPKAIIVRLNQHLKMTPFPKP